MRKKSRELEEALRLITKALYDPRLDQGDRDELRTAKREIELATHGSVDAERLYRAIELVSTVMLRLLKQVGG